MLLFAIARRANFLIDKTIARDLSLGVRNNCKYLRIRYRWKLFSGLKRYLYLRF